MLINLGKKNWIFGEIICYKNKWMAQFTKMVHSKIVVKRYDYIFECLELIRTDTKTELIDICNQFIYQIEKNKI